MSNTESFFYKTVDRRSRKAMESFLKSHRRYSTMNSWNAIDSYANCVKVDELGLSNEQIDKALEMILVPGFVNNLARPIIEDFTEQHNGHWTLCFNGRNSGYVVLYQSYRQPIPHKSFCTCCGQRNFEYAPPEQSLNELERTVAHYIESQETLPSLATLMEVPAIAALGGPKSLNEKMIASVRRIYQEGYSKSGLCGVCKHPRSNYLVIPKQLVIRSIGAADYEDREDWTMDELRDEVALVQSVDKACDAMRQELIHALNHMQVSEKTIHVPKTIKTLEPIV